MVTPRSSSAEEGDKTSILQMKKRSPREGKQLSQALETRTQDPLCLSLAHPSTLLPDHSPELPWAGRQAGEPHKIELKAETPLLLTECP